MLPGGKDGPAYGSSVMNPKTVIINGGYLIRSVDVTGSTLSVNADFNATTSLEIIGAPEDTTKLVLNGEKVEYTKNGLGNWVVKPAITFPETKLPDLKSLKWKGIDTLPEIKASYDDGRWVNANLDATYNSFTPLKTPVSLYGSDYGFNTGTLLLRGAFEATGNETSLSLRTVGGLAYGSSAWLNETFLGSVKGNPDNADISSIYKIPDLIKGKTYVLTVVVDNMGLNENLVPGYDSMKEPRGVLEYRLRSALDVETKINTWKITGNLGGEAYKDHFRGPLNEGGFFFERQGYHLPSPPLDQFRDISPFEGIKKAGIQYYTTSFSLDLPSEKYDIPLSFVFDNSTSTGAYRAFLYVNGFQFGKYINYIGPQTDFPVPEGILNYKGENWIGLALWALDDTGSSVPGLALKASRQPVLTSRNKIDLVKGPSYSKRTDAY